MWRFLLIVGLVVVFSCKEKRDSIDDFATNQKDNILEGFSFSIDTLMVDTGEDFINFGIPFIAAQSPDAKFYYILNYKTVHLQKIDLDSLKLIDTFRFYRDGTNSPGLTISFYPIQNDDFPFDNLFECTDSSLEKRAPNITSIPFFLPKVRKTTFGPFNDSRPSRSVGVR